MIRPRDLVLALLISSVALGCATGAKEPTVAEANAFLGQVVTLAQRHDFQGLCALGDGNCEQSLDHWGRDAVPSDPPSLISTRLLPATKSEAGVSTGGVIFVLCGRDGTGNPYNSEMLVFRDGSSLRAINVVYWGDGKIGGGITTPSSPPQPPAC